MKVLLSWIKDYIDINETPEKIAEALTMTGLEVEEIIQPGKNIKGVVVGKILTKEAHPDSDHLTLCTVDVGQGEPLQIVCGAKNHKAGDIVPVAMIGAKSVKPKCVGLILSACFVASVNWAYRKTIADCIYFHKTLSLVKI